MAFPQEVSVSKVLFETKSASVNSVRIRSNVICAGLHNGVVQVWHYNDHAATLACRFRHSPLPVRGVDIHHNLGHVVSAGDDFEIKLWDCATTLSDAEEAREPVVCFIGHRGVVRSVQFNPRDPSWLVSSSEDKTVRMWNFSIATGSARCMRTFFGHTDAVTCAEFCYIEHLIVSSSMDQTVCVWETTTGRLKFHMTGHTGGIKSVAFHPTLPLIVSTGDDRQVKVWRVKQTKAWEVDSLRGHTDNVSSGLMSSGADLVLTGGEDGTIRVWDLAERLRHLTIRLDRIRDPSKSYSEISRMIANQAPRISAIAENPAQCNVLAAAHDSGFIVFEIQLSRVEGEHRFPPCGEITMPSSCMPIFECDLDYDESGIIAKRLETNRLRNMETSLQCHRVVITVLFSLLSCFLLLSVHNPKIWLGPCALVGCFGCLVLVNRS